MCIINTLNREERYKGTPIVKEEKPIFELFQASFKRYIWHINREYPFAKCFIQLNCKGSNNKNTKEVIL
jgi:hypothetical protein